jgi:TRAP transporter 4TM/12TM fusion protein
MSSSEAARMRTVQPWLLTIIRLLAVCLVAAGAFFSLNLQIHLGWSVLQQQFYGFIFAISLFTALLIFPARPNSPRDHAPWSDIVLALLGASCGVYVMIFYPSLALNMADVLWHKVFFGALAIVLVIEACRRIYGIVLPVLTLAFIVYGLFAEHFPGMFQTSSIPIERFAMELLLSDQAMLGTIMQILATIVLVYVVFGHLLFTMGGGTLFTDLALAAMGKYRGGPAKVAVLGSAFFGSISNSAVANVVITGSVTIPMMKRIGYRPQIAGAVEATASTGGLVTPPVMSAVAFVMAEYLQMPYGQVVIAAIIPALLYYGALILQVDLEAGRTGMRGLEPSEIPNAWDVLKKGWPFLIPLPVLIYTLVWLLWQPETAGMFATFVLIASGYWFVRDKPLRWWYDTIADAGVQVTEIIIVGLLVGMILGASSMTGLSFTLTEPLLALGAVSSFLLLVATAIISLILGMGLPGIAIYFMQVTLIVPALVKFGITPIAAHFFIFYYGVFSLITPPVAVAAMAAAGIAKASPWDTGIEACKMGIVAFIVPFVFVYSPTLLAQGPIWLITTNFVSAAVGVLAIGAALRGYFLAEISFPVRLVLFAAAIGLFLPVDGHHALVFVNIGSLAVVAVLLALNGKAAGARDANAKAASTSG